MKGQGKDNTTMTDDRPLLEEDVARLFKMYFGEVLNILSARFPHTRGDGSSNETEFQGLRAKILRCGNNKLRTLPDLLKCYSVEKTSVISTQTIHIIGQRYKVKK